MTLLPLANLLVGCSATVTPPVRLAEPVPVFVANYGYHASILLPRGQERVTEYAFGEWKWFALGEEQWYRVFPALLWPTPAALGRRELAGPPQAELIDRQIFAQELHEFAAERSRVDALLAKLDARYGADGGTPLLRSDLGLHFVHDPEPYWIFNQCNSSVARWLRELGCKVEGCPLESDFRFARPEASARAPAVAPATQEATRADDAAEATPSGG